MITTRHLTWDAPGGARILHDVDMALTPGTLTGVVGPNGSGKTTLLHLLAGLRRPSGGEVFYDDEPLSTWHHRERARRIALVEQHPATSLDLTARDVVDLGRIPHRGRWPGAPDPHAESVEEALAIAGVTELADRRWSTMSGGERQRTHLARALAQRPEVLLLDEPTNHLDLYHQIDFLGRVADLPLTTVAVLHDLDLAAAFCLRLVVMCDGRVAAAGATADVLTPELIDEVFGVRAALQRDDRLRLLWSDIRRPTRPRSHP
ncbi:MAG: ABC transporter ATP-binding protein [Mobilicoccus sp.]|nr:ABC transporter ATP-binding protein [Mobilicoccus sp.]